MTCAQIDELAGAIALDALPEEEWEAVRAHLATCVRGHPELRELVLLAARLVETVPDVEPPPALGDRLMRALRADIERTDAIEDLASTIGAVAGPPARVTAVPRETPPTAPAPPVSQEPKVVPLAPRRSPWYARAASGWTAAAAALLLAVGLGAWSLSLRGDLDDTRARLTDSEQVLTALAAGGEIVPFASTATGAEVALLRPVDGTPALLVRGLERVPDRIYQLWMLRGSTPVSLGVFDTDDDGATVVPVTSDLSGVDALAITSEPSPNGSPQPTSEPMLVAPLRG